MNEERLDDCGCCEGTASATPVEADNLPGQSRIVYRVGTHARFKESMLAGLSRRRPLDGLQSRADDDASIAWLDGVATVLDVLSFYHERIANEGFLGTATERRSVLELARAIGYELNPGVAASTHLAFTMEEAAGAPATVQLAVGTKAQSIPEQDEKAQTFETIASIEARPAWNRLRPRRSTPAPYKAGDTAIYLAGTDANLKPGDVLVFVGDERRDTPSDTRYDVRRVTSVSVEPKRGRTLVNWLPALAHGALKDPQVFVMRTRAALFGHNAQKWKALPAAQRVGEIVHTSKTDTEFKPGVYAGRKGSWAEARFSAGTTLLALDSVCDGVAAHRDSWLVLSKKESTFRLFGIEAVSETSVADFNLSAKVTRLTISGPDIQKFSPRNASAFLKSEALKPADAPITEPLTRNDWLLGAKTNDLKRGQWIAITEQHLDDAGNPIGKARSDVVQIHEVSEKEGLTQLRFERDLKLDFDREWTTLNANVAPATHGETRKEVLGSGDASKPLQQFALKQKPLTCVASSATSGATSTLAIRVNDVLWHETPSLYGYPPTEALFVTRLDDDGTVRITFGDGERGRRLPTGVENVEASYRVGTGLAGLVKPRQISLLASRPLGLKEVVNPLAPTGAEDPESMADARANAPFTVLTLDRVVSLSDFEDFARAFGGIAKARAAWLWDREARIVHLTLAAPKGDSIDPLGSPALGLRTAIDARRHSKIALRIASYAPRRFALNAALRIAEDHDKEKVRQAVKKALVDTFSFERQAFAVPLSASRVIAVMQQVEGVVAVDLNLFHFVGQTTELVPVLAALPARWDGAAIAPAELIVIDPDAVTLSEMPP